MAELQPFLDAAIESAREAGALIKQVFESPKRRSDFEEKVSNSDLVTETDKACEVLIKSLLQSRFPNHKFIGEETAAEEGKITVDDEWTWIIDPIDGTTNFIGRIPFVAVSIGLVHNQIPQVGVVYNPIMNQMFTAARGQGAFLNGNRITASPVRYLSQSVVACEWGSDHSESVIGAKIAAVNKVLTTSLPPSGKGARGARSLGSAALNLCYVAQGIFDLYYEVGVHVWDICAAVVIVTEAGGQCLSVNGTSLNIFKRRIVAGGIEPGPIQELVPLLTDLAELPLVPDA